MEKRKKKALFKAMQAFPFLPNLHPSLVLKSDKYPMGAATLPNTPKKRLLRTETCPIPFRQKSAKEQKISVLKLISDTVAPSNPSQESTQKHDFSDVIIAAAAAKMVKLDSEGFVSLLNFTILFLSPSAYGTRY